MSGARLLGAAAVIVALLAVPAAAQVTDDELDVARAEVRALQAELNDLAGQYEAAVAREVELADNISILESQIEASEVEIDGFRDRINERAADMYMDAAGSGLVTVLSASSPNELGTRSEYLGDVGRSDNALVNLFVLRNEQFDEQQLSLEDLRIEQEAQAAELSVLASDLNGRLESAQADYNELYEQFVEEERQRRIEAERRAREAAEAAARAATSSTVPDPNAPPTTAGEPPPASGGQVCPIAGINSFTDTWGAPRSGGRFHQGVDMLAARGTPVVAIESGSVSRVSNSNLGGITVWMRGDSGDTFYYAHLDSWAPGLSAGQRVDPGTLLGTVGTTGNAPAHIPHLHWEYHPGGGGAVNPTPLARSVCG